MNTPKIRQISFKTELVEQIIAGNKTQTRRPFRVQPWPDTVKIERWKIHHDAFEFNGHVMYEAYDAPQFRESGVPLWLGTTSNGECHEYGCLYGDPGDYLAVKETYGFQGEQKQIIYRAGGDKDHPQVSKWQPGRFMKKEYTRLLLRITEVRGQHLQEITEQEVLKEGFPGKTWQAPNGQLAGGFVLEHRTRKVHSYQIGGPVTDWYADLWDQMHGKDPGLCWKSNPWVWAISFEKVAFKADGPIELAQFVEVEEGQKGLQVFQ